MKKKLDLSIKQVFRYLYILLLIANLVLVILVFNYTKKYVYRAIFVDRSMIEGQAMRGSGDINVEQFEEIIERIEKKDIHY